VKKLLRANHEVRRFLALQGAGQMGDAMISLALAQVVVFQLERGATPGAIARVLLTATLPYLLIGPIAGFISDRWPRRASLAAVSLVRCWLALGALAVPLTANRLLGYATASCLLAAGGVAYTLRSSSIPHLVRPDQLVAVNSMVGLTQKVAGTLGFGFGALLVHLSPLSALIVGASLHLSTVYGYHRVRFDLGGGSASDTRGVPIRRVLTRLARLATTSPTRGAIAGIVAQRALYGAAFASFVLLADARYDLSASGLALAIAMTATGAFAGTVLVVPVTSLLGRRGAVLMAFLLCSSVMLFGGFNGESWAVMTAMIVGSFSFQTVRLVSDSTVQGHIADDALGRVFAGYDALCNLAYVSGALVRVFLIPGSSPLAFAVIALAYLAGTTIPLSSMGYARLSLARIPSSNARRPR